VGEDDCFDLKLFCILLFVDLELVRFFSPLLERLPRPFPFPCKKRFKARSSVLETSFSTPIPNTPDDRMNREYKRIKH
jgi:hypothetical protein